MEKNEATKLKYVLVVFTLLCISLTMTLFTVTGLIPTVNNIALFNQTNIEEIDYTVGQQGKIRETNNSFAYVVTSFADLESEGLGKKYATMSLADQSALYLQSGMDFPTGLYYFFNYIIKGSTLLYPILVALGVPNQIMWFIITPVAFMFILAMIQFISGRSFEANK